jgi:hypothetical protein
MFLIGYAKLCIFTYSMSVSAGILPTLGWNTFTYPLPYNGSSRSIFAAGSILNISWIPGGQGPSGPISILLLGGILNTTVPPEIACEYLFGISTGSDLIIT